MRDQLIAEEPQLLQPGEWHLPYVRESDRPNHPDALKAISVARCARVSYLTHDGKETTPFDDLKLFERLVGAQPLHASPAEHQATPDVFSGIGAYCEDPTAYSPDLDFENSHERGNFRGWRQYRKMLQGEFVPG